MRRKPARVVFGCASVLLSYPEDSFPEDLAAVDAALRDLPSGSARAQLAATTAWLAGLTTTAAAASYVETFDLHRRASLHLTYYRHGDTRERGLALAALADAYRAAGLALAPGELPDFLPALLELAAVAPAGAALLREQRAGLDALAATLEKDGSPYLGAVAAVGAALPAPSPSDRAALRRYRAQGPPSERVGLEPFAPPELLGEAGGAGGLAGGLLGEPAGRGSGPVGLLGEGDRR